MGSVERLTHLILALAILAAYVGLTLAGHNADILIGILIGQGGALGVQKLTKPPVAPDAPPLRQ